MKYMIIYGRGLIAEEYCRFLRARGMGDGIACFAVTSLGGQGAAFCGLPCMEIKEALERFPEAEIHLALQEKYHAEVIALLRGLGRKPASVIGLHRMTELLGEQGIEQISKACPELAVRRCPHDYSMLEICPREQTKRKFTFYPMTQVPLSDRDMANLRMTVGKATGSEAKNQNLPIEGARKCGSPVGSLVGDREAVDEVLYIAMATSAKDARVGHENLPPFVHPVLGGAASCEGERSEDLAYDDEGDNISEYNHLYSELTVAFWLWKKAPKEKYLGLCHYRRHFLLTEEVRRALAEGRADVILTTPRLTFPNVHKYFAELPVTTMDEGDFQLMLRLIEREDSEMARFSRDFLEGQIHYPNNMVIAKRDIYLGYCSFMFKVLQGMQEEYQRNNIARPERYLGYVGELLTTVYFAYHHKKWRTEYIDYELLKEV